MTKIEQKQRNHADYGSRRLHVPARLLIRESANGNVLMMLSTQLDIAGPSGNS